MLTKGTSILKLMVSVLSL